MVRVPLYLKRNKQRIGEQMNKKECVVCGSNTDGQHTYKNKNLCNECFQFSANNVAIKARAIKETRKTS